MKRSSNYQRTLEEIFDSDDELTNDYSEASYLPAYQDDTRFDFRTENKTPEKDKKVEKPTPATSEKFVNQAIFSKKDVYCLQCIQKISNDTLLWFFKFLLHKDLQSNYKFLKSCLVPKYDVNYSKSVCESISYITNEAKCGYRVVLK